MPNATAVQGSRRLRNLPITLPFFGGVRDMRLTPETPALRRWRLWLGAVIIAEICWFALLHPRIGSYRTILVLALLPLTVVGYVYLMAAVSAYLAERRW